METFITSICENDLGTPEITTCEYGGVVMYIPILVFLLLVFGTFYYYTYYIVKKVL